MSTREYGELGADAGSRLKYAVILDGYRDHMASADTHVVGVTGKLNTHFGTQLRQWRGQFRVQASPPAGYGTIAQLEALHATQDTALSWLAPEEASAVNVVWVGPWDATYINPPLTEALVKFTLRETGL